MLVLDESSLTYTLASTNANLEVHNSYQYNLLLRANLNTTEDQTGKIHAISSSI